MCSTKFETVARAWHENRKASRAASWGPRVLSRMERDIFPAIGQMRITDIDAPTVLALIRKVEARGAVNTGKRLRQNVGQVFRFAIASGLATRDPSAALSDALKPVPRVRHRAKLNMKEMSDFLRKLSHYDGDTLTRLAIQFTLLTWVRTSETRFAEWSEFEEMDDAAPLWRIPAERMKMHREHIVPLSRQAVAVLKQVHKISGDGKYVFPGSRGKPVMSVNTMLFGLYRMGYHSRATIHGLRGTASTWANESGRYHRDWIEMQLAHADADAIRSAYNAAIYLMPRRAMLQEWADLMDAEAMVGAMFG